MGGRPKRMMPQPPRWAERFFEWYCSPPLHEELEGDLYERFCHTLKLQGEKKARRQYVFNVFGLLGPHTLKRRKKSYQQQLYIPMFKNYLTVAWRSLQKRKAYAFINISGLAVGIACAFLMLAYVQQELSYDKFHEKKDRIYRATMNASFGGRVVEATSTPTALVPTLKREFPEVEEGVRMLNSGMFGPTVVKYEEKLFEENRFFYADSTFFDIFSFKMHEGNPKKALVQPNSIVLTESKALKYFHGEDAVGKNLRIDDNKDYVVTGIVEDAPENSHLKFDFLASFSSLGASKEEIWWSANYLTYFTLRPGSSIDQMQEKMPELMKKYVGADLGSSGDYLNYKFMPLADIHLYSNIKGEIEPSGSYTYIYILSFIAFMIVAIACINYMNLATAKASERAKEVGVRKVMGAVRGQIFGQFMSEAFLITMCSLFLALFIIAMAVPYFNQLTGKSFDLQILADPMLLGGLALLGILVSLVAGSYPAIALSGFKPVAVLKGKFQDWKGSVVLRKGLVVFQFAVSMFLVFGTLVIYKQLSYIRNKDLGYNKEQVLVLPVDDKIVGMISTFKSELLRDTNVEAISMSTDYPSYIKGGFSYHLEGMPENEDTPVTATTIDKDYVKTLGLEIIAGQDITEAEEKAALLRGDSVKAIHSFIVNESFVKSAGYEPEKVIGMKMNMNSREGQIKAVVKDFHFASLHEEIRPLIMFIEPEYTAYMLVRIDAENYEATLDQMASKWKTLAPHRPFEYDFLDEKFESVYVSETRMGNVFNTFSVIAILIACLGLFGLASYTAVQRAKEIGVRKVLGASIMSVILLLSKDFIKLIGIAMLIAIPAAYWAMNIWLEDFAFKIDITWIIPLAAASITFITAIATVSFESFKAAKANPVSSLKSE